MYTDKEIANAIKYNFGNYGCADPFNDENNSVDDLMHYYYANLEEDSEREGD